MSSDKRVPGDQLLLYLVSLFSKKQLGLGSVFMLWKEMSQNGPRITGLLSQGVMTCQELYADPAFLGAAFFPAKVTEAANRNSDSVWNL